MILQCENGHVTYVQSAMNEFGVDAVFDSKHHSSCFIAAVAFNQTDLVTLLVDGGYDVNRNDGYYTALHHAVERSNAQMVKILLNSGAEVNLRNRYNQTVLHEAVKNGNVEIIMILLNSGADVNARDKYNMTVLHYMAYDAYEKIFKYRDIWLPRHRFVWNSDMEMTRILLYFDADVNAQDKWHITPLHLSVCNNDTEMANILLNAGAEVDARDQYHSTPLLRSASNGYTKMIQILLEAGSEVNTRANDNRTPLHHSAKNSDAEMTRILLDAGAEVNARAKNNQTPLHHSAYTWRRRGNVETMRMLLDAGAEVNAQDKANWTALHFSEEIGETEKMRVLLNAGAEVDAREKNGFTPLYRSACVNRNVETMRILLDAGAEVDVRVKYGQGGYLTPLLCSAWFLNTEMAKILLDAGAEVNAHDAPDNQTALHLAVTARYRHDDYIGEMIDLLVKRGAEIEAKDKNGATPLTLAILGHKVPDIGELVKHGASVENAKQCNCPPRLNDWARLSCAKRFENAMRHVNVGREIAWGMNNKE